MREESFKPQFEIVYWYRSVSRGETFLVQVVPVILILCQREEGFSSCFTFDTWSYDTPPIYDLIARPKGHVNRKKQSSINQNRRKTSPYKALTWRPKTSRKQRTFNICKWKKKNWPASAVKQDIIWNICTEKTVCQNVKGWKQKAVSNRLKG